MKLRKISLAVAAHAALSQKLAAQLYEPTRATGVRVETWPVSVRAKSTAALPATPRAPRESPQGSDKSCRCRQGREETLLAQMLFRANRSGRKEIYLFMFSASDGLCPTRCENVAG